MAKASYRPAEQDRSSKTSAMPRLHDHHSPERPVPELGKSQNSIRFAIETIFRNDRSAQKAMSDNLREYSTESRSVTNPVENALEMTGAAPTLAIHDLAELTRISRRSIAPSIPRGARVTLDLLPQDLPARRGWERAVGRWGRACGCEQSGLAFLLVVGGLMSLHFMAAINLGPGFLPMSAWWIAAGLTVSVTAKAAVVLMARHSLAKLHTQISTAASAD